MYKQFFANMGVELPLFALFVFLALFIAISVRVFLVKSKGDYERDAQMPLSEGTSNQVGL